jgi:hypothetical protein
MYLGYDTSAPYSKAVNTTLVTDGQHTLRARAVDNAGNTSEVTAAVLVANMPGPPSVSIASPTTWGPHSGTVNITASAAGPSGITKVQFWYGGLYLGYDSTAPYAKSIDTTSLNNGRYTLRARAVASNGETDDAILVIDVVNPDSTPPTAAITSPSNGATVSGTIQYQVTAADSQGLQKVQFWLGGMYLGYDSKAPYSKSVNTNAVSNGVHTLRARAVDWAGNVTETTITVTVSN